MTGNVRFKKLLEPAYIGQVRTKNRIIKCASGTSYLETSGYVGERAKGYYETMAKGGVGLIIVESCGIEYPSGLVYIPLQFHLDDDKYIPSYSELTQVIHKHGCPTFLQLFHPGPWNPAGLLPKHTKSSSALTESELPRPGFDLPRELTIAEIEELVDKFAQAAERAQKAGFDGVEINGASCHLINAFLSRIWNKRQDVYGCGSLENRSRFMVEIIREIKKRLGQDSVVTTLINIAEYGHEKGTTIKEGTSFARLLQEAGADAIQLRAHDYVDPKGMPHYDRIFYPEPPESLPKDLDWSRQGAGATVPMAEAVKKIVSVPVFTACRLDPELGEEILRQGKVDFVGMTRRLLADPELPNKVASGRLEDIAPCMGCLYCMDMREQSQPVRCRVNASLGREREYEIKPAEKKKRVLVAGGGPAGMEAARVAALRGHEVILYEREHELGGLIPVAAVVKELELKDLVAFVSYLRTQITKLGVAVRLGEEFNLSVVEEFKPDVVILAIGGIPTVANIPGIDKHNVVSISTLHRTLKNYLRFLEPKTIEGMTSLLMPIGKRVVIIGGSIQGCELAEFLVKRGRKVTIVDMAEALAEGMTRDEKRRLFNWLDKKGVTMMTGVKYEEITDKELVITTKDGERKALEADTIVTTFPLKPNTDLLKSLNGKVPEIYPIGDCREPGLIADAIADGSHIAYTI
ncbi:MAG: FAD-dependent oxidoreductase [Dehalococcoidia bacterium]